MACLFCKVKDAESAQVPYPERSDDFAAIICLVLFYSRRRPVRPLDSAISLRSLQDKLLPNSGSLGPNPQLLQCSTSSHRHPSRPPPPRHRHRISSRYSPSGVTSKDANSTAHAPRFSPSDAQNSCAWTDGNGGAQAASTDMALHGGNHLVMLMPQQ